VRNHRRGKHPAHPQCRTAKPDLRLSDASNPLESPPLVSCQSLCWVRVSHRLRLKRRHLRNTPRVCVGSIFCGVGRVRCAVGHCAGGQLCLRSAGKWSAERCRLTTRSARTPTGGAARLGGRRLPLFVRAHIQPWPSRFLTDLRACHYDGFRNGLSGWTTWSNCSGPRWL